MQELYLEVFSNVSEDGICFVPLETVIVLFLYEYCDRPPLFTTLVLTPDLSSRPHFKIKFPELLFEAVAEDDVEIPGNLCKLPVLVTNAGTTCIAGLCAVLRQMLKMVNPKHELLGFKQNCLNACAEMSVWTKFCEVDVVKTVKDLFLKSDWSHAKVIIPYDIARFEVHLGKPVRTHNIQKEKQVQARGDGLPRKSIRSGLPDSRLNLIQDLEHTYSEGHKMSLADLILLPCFHLVFQFIGNKVLRQKLPLSYEWYENLMVNERIQEAFEFLAEVEAKFDCEIHVEYLIPEVPNSSLYKSEGIHSRVKKCLYTKQEVVESSFETVSNIDIRNALKWENTTFGHDVAFDWKSMPVDVQLEGSQFPEKRLERKAQQLENMTKAVLKIAKDGDCIVDFCSGSGYLGLILAYSLPRCKVILLENKEESLKRAQERALILKLANVFFCQGNIDYFRGTFNVGVSLHACGIATDLVMEKCLTQRASFICCPCCYGSIQPNHMIEYPRSEKYRNSPLTIKEYLTLAHSSDQTHDESNHKTSQGKKCMAIIDTDRCFRAIENGYTVSVSTFEPSSCTPKNNLLVGISAS